MPKRALTVHIVKYTCESCGAEHTRSAGMHTDGMCKVCGFPMRINDLFGDRRIASVPVTLDRRIELGEAEAA